MSTSSLIKLQREAILDVVRKTYPEGQWRYFVADTEALTLIDKVLKRDDILHQNIAGVEEIQQKRTPKSDMEAVYLLTPKPYVLDCLVSEFKRPKPRYMGGHLVWTSSLPDSMRQHLVRQVQESGNRNWILSERILPINFHPAESHVFTFQDPKSFFPLYHPRCDNLAQREFSETAKRIVGVCVALEEFPVIRYFMSPHLNHRARQLPQMIAFAVQRELELYQQYMESQGLLWPPEDKSRPRGILFVVDRSLDPTAPLLHEFTYQAMAHDLLPIKDEDGKLTYTPKNPTPESKPYELNEEDKVWTKVRHLHMTEATKLVMADLEKFVKENPNFENVQNANTVFAIKTMLATLPQFTETKDAYELHTTMAQDCMDIFGESKLADTADLEQNLATGLDANNDKAKGLTEQLVKLLDSPTTLRGNDRIRLIILYLLWRDGLVGPDIEKLCRHAKIPPHVKQALYNLDLIGVRIVKRLKEPNRPGYKNPIAKGTPVPEGMELSRYVPAVKTMLEDHVKGTLDTEMFPFADQSEEAAHAGATTATSLRTAKPTWTKQRLSTIEPRQRIIVFVAGGATYSEARSCYEISKASVRDVYLGSSHIITPDSWLEQLSYAREDRSRLNLEADLPPEMRPKAPAHLFEPDVVAKPPPQPNAAAGSSGKVPQAKLVQKPGQNGRPMAQTMNSGGSQGSFNTQLSSVSSHNSSHTGEKKEKKRHKFLGLK
ncbi:hypothetical protein ABW19_dt0201704 [Dactylella cylindrospora]|nr:hypothetical protein ABW19_dt0201704 [Dactylella cylindrospora]